MFYIFVKNTNPKTTQLRLKNSNENTKHKQG